ncbi:Fibrinogen-like protein A [Holothuria leucospilota]|uniref:Fibrinogen-like protein A n=1 Tax=Holothuria leucospilota TaxID=206669 RepID=A0A9Q1BVY2_HOLLE|nr:Fibrinogen-like protein A [Holothuria leucospilota]
MMQFLHNAMWISIIVLFNWIYLIRGQTNQPKTNHELLSQIGYSYYFYQTPTNPRDCQDLLDLYSLADVDDAYYIRPVGFPKAFEAHCDPSDDGGGWTVIYRRHYGYIEFNRTWEEYKDGFGFLGSEFWIGNKKLAFLTNQRQYEIQLFIENAGGFSFYVHYNFFRISDERSNFKLVGLGSYTGNIESLIYHCPTNMVYGNCTCQPTCEDPDGSIECLVTCPEGEACICREGFVMKGGICVPIEECGCYIPGEGLVPKNRFHAQPMCISRCLCQANVLICGIAYGCSLNAACAVRNGIRKCYCNEGFTGDGQTCEVLATDCADIYDGGVTDSGVFTIKPTDWPGSPFEVYCDMTDGGGWTPRSHYNEFGWDSDPIFVSFIKIFSISGQKEPKICQPV